MKNVFIRLLEALSIPYTYDFADELYATHPNKDNMLGLYQMCEVYGIASKGVNVADKNCDELSIPSVLHVGGQFVILTDLTDDEITYDWNGQRTTQSKSDFIRSWDGNALMIEADTGAAEPSFTEHRKQDRRKHAQLVITIALMLACGGILFFQSLNSPHLLSCIFAVTDALGIGICCLLLQKQVFSSSDIGDRVCSLFHQKDCNNLLFSDASKIYGYSWSEVGLGYFAAHFLIACMLPDALPLLSVVSWAVMCYGFWSIYYQARVAKQWCVLCVFVQILLWGNGIVSMFFADSLITVTLTETLLLARNGIYILAMAMITIFVTHQLAAAVATKQSLRKSVFQYRALKCHAEVFRQMLHQSQFVEVGTSDSAILFGNKEASMRITVLTNPHCNPCSKKHKEIDELIARYGTQFSVQYLFMAFNETLKRSNRFLIAAYQQQDEQAALKVYREWYEHGRNNAEAFMAEHPNIRGNTSAVNQEMERQTSWINKAGFTATPTILVNGYVLPPAYSLADLPMFVDIPL